MSRLTGTVLAIIILVTTFGCGGNSGFVSQPPPPPPAVKGQVSVIPDSDTLGPEGRRQFQAVLTDGSGNIISGSVTWNVDEGATGGTVDSNGLYTAPGGTGTFHLTATDAADSTISDKATITVAPSGFTRAADMEVPRAGHTATLLKDGRVLLAGGDASAASAELFDPATQTFGLTGSMELPRIDAYAVLLGDGKVLLAGGTDANGLAFTESELFDPATGSFTPTGDMTTPRSGATVTLLQSGKVLIASGVDNSDAFLDTAELYDPATGTFAATPGHMTSGRWNHKATLLADGKVLLTGGRVNFSPNTNTATAELFDPSSSTFSVTGPMTAGREQHSATFLANGQVLVLGGISPGNNFSLDTGELYDPTTAGFTSAASLRAPRHSHSAILLPSGKIVVAGGEWKFFDDDGLPDIVVLRTAELLDPSAGSSDFVGSLETERVSFTATLLNDGRVLVTGGVDGNGAVLKSAELYK